MDKPAPPLIVPLFLGFVIVPELVTPPPPAPATAVQSRQLVGEVGSMPAPQDDPIGALEGEQAIAVVFDLMDPVRAGRRLCNKRRLGGLDEAGGRAAPRTRGTPQHPSHIGGRRRARPRSRRPRSARNTRTIGCPAWVSQDVTRVRGRLRPFRHG